MPTTPSPTPALHGRGGAALRHEDGPLAGNGRKARGPAWAAVALGPSLTALVTMSVLVVTNGQPAALVLAALMGVTALILNIISTYTMERGYLMWRLPRHGITVTAARTRPGGATGTYRYTDHSGTARLHHRQAYAPEIKISYDPNAPGTNVGVYSVPVRLLVALSSLLLWGATTGLIWLMIHIGRTI